MKKKQSIKKESAKNQSGRSAVSALTLPQDSSFMDKHRKIPKKDGGTYTKKNTVVLFPTEHMEEHGNLRIRNPEMEELKTLIDSRNNMVKLKNKINNQMMAYMRGTDNPDMEDLEIMEEEIKKFEKLERKKVAKIKKFMKEYRKINIFVDAALNINGLKELTMALMLVYVDLEKARYPSSLVKYVGLHTPSHERYKKGESGGGNKTLRTALHAFAISQNMGKGKINPSAYGEVYDRRKAVTEVSEKITKSYPGAGKKLQEMMWKDTKPGHRHADAFRAIIKHFLSDYWLVGRSILGLPTSPLYVSSVLGHKGIISPEERGWKVGGYKFVRDSKTNVVSLVKEK